ncbi:class I SAM-dependent methyltransferase [Candidatus Woesearchaeota archaeon]|nr:class I SAM-dependent methyltransferase [Candidatus Woesearchaeota archaeon]
MGGKIILRDIDNSAISVDVNKAKNFEYPIEVILNDLGPDLLTSKGKLLDLGCGVEGGLVELCLKLGFRAKGIDLRASGDKSYLIRGSYDNIPEPDGFYDVVTAHKSAFRNLGPTSRKIITARDGERVWLEEYSATKKKAIRYLEEALRVLRPGGQLRIFSEPDIFLWEIMSILYNSGVEVKREEIGGADRYRPFIKNNLYQAGEDCLHRVILTKLEHYEGLKLG